MADECSEKTRLHFMTYMWPEIPLDTFCLLRDYIEDATGLETDLTIEDRFSGPTQKRTDPFESNRIDIMAVRGSDYLRLKAEGYDKMELCGAAPVHKHPLTGDRPVYYSEIIIHASNRQKYKTMKDLKGCTWGYNNETSLSGNIIVLQYLENSFGTNASYFGNTIESGSHLNSIQMVKDYRVEAAAVDSTVLTGYFRTHEDSSDKISSILSLGPLPIYPLLFNVNLSEHYKQKITEALMSMHRSHTWASKLNEVGISKYVTIDSTLYSLGEQIYTGAQGMNINPTYY